MIQVLTICWGTKYSPDYVERLAAGVARNLHVEHEFCCLTDGCCYAETWPDSVDYHRLPNLPLESWWWKLWVFARENRAGFYDRGILWLDLDTVVLDDIDFLVGGDEFLCLGNIWFPRTWGSGIMWIPPGWGHEIWKEFCSKAEFYMRQTPRSDGRLGDQGFIYDCCRERNRPPVDHDPRIQARWPGKVLSYKAELLGHQLAGRRNPPQEPDDAAIVYFHGPPRPHEVVDKHSWMREHWTRERVLKNV